MLVDAGHADLCPLDRGGVAMAGHCDCQIKRAEKAAFIGDALAGDVEGRSVIDRCPDHRKTHGHVHRVV